MSALIVSAMSSGAGSGAPYLETAANQRSGLLKPSILIVRNEVQSLSYVDADENPASPTDGSYVLSFGGHSTGALDYDATASDIQSALETLSSIGSGNVSVSGTGPFTIEFVGALAGAPQSLLTSGADSLVAADNTVRVETTTNFAAGSTGTVSTVTLFSDSTANYGSWNLGGANYAYNDPVVNSPPSGWTVTTGFSIQSGALTLQSTSNGAAELSWDTTNLFTNDLGSGGVQVNVSDEGTFSQGDPDVPPTYQIDTITLDTDVTGGEWELGGTSGIASDDSGSGVQSAYTTWASANGYSAATVTKTGPATYTVSYAMAADETAVTAALAAVTFGDTLTKEASAVIARVQVGG